MDLNSREKELYSRHLSLSQVGEKGQLRLKSAKLLLVGAGGLGGPIALYLAAAGVGDLKIIDHDRVALSNLQRQILFSTQDIGQFKAERAQEKLAALNPEIKVTAINERFSEQNARALIQDSDFVIDATDNFATRYLINDTCVAENKSFIFGAIYRFDAQVAVFHHKNGPCYRCLYPKSPPQEAISNCQEAGVLGVLPGTVGTLMATEALKLILEIGETLSESLLTYDSLRGEFLKRRLIRQPNCPSCGETKQQDEIERKFNLVQPGEPIENYFILDVRDELEFHARHLPAAKNIALGKLRERINEIPKQKDILLVCKSGKRSQRAAEILQDSGWSQLFNLQGGMDALNENF